MLALVAIDDLAFADVARILGCSEETARTHLRRARATMQQLLKPNSADFMDTAHMTDTSATHVTNTNLDAPKEG